MSFWIWSTNVERPLAAKSTASVRSPSLRTASNNDSFKTMPSAMRASMLLSATKLMAVMDELCCPMRFTRPMRWFFFAGFQGKSKLITVSANCRFNPEPPASVDRKTRLSGFCANSSMSLPRFATGTSPLNMTWWMPWWPNRLLMICSMVFHSEKISTFFFFPMMSSFSSKISCSSSNLGE